MQLKDIAPLDLSQFKRPAIPGNPHVLIRACWYLTNAMVFRSAILGLLPSALKVRLLRVFGAKLGQGLVIKPRVDIKSPWFLETGDHVWLGENVWIDNHTTVKIGSNVCISQGAYLFTGNHDWSVPSFAFSCKPITIGNSVWIPAFCAIEPGSIIPDCKVVLHSRL